MPPSNIRTLPSRKSSEWEMDDKVNAVDMVLSQKDKYPSAVRRISPTKATSPSKTTSSYKSQKFPSERKRLKKSMNGSYKYTKLRITNVVLILLTILVFFGYKYLVPMKNVTTALMGASISNSGNIVGYTKLGTPLSCNLPSTNNVTTQGLDMSENIDTPVEIIHVIHTRFMQNQPHLIELGHARLKLFQAFCISSLELQTSKKFIWVIRTDPNLNETLREPLIQMLSDHTNHLLVASNDNPNVQIDNLLNIKPESVWSGDITCMQQYIKRGSVAPYFVLETRLDADDGLHYKFVETLQQEATKYILHHTRNVPAWRIWCAYRHMEWQYSPPWSENSTATDLGALTAMRVIGCISAGLTIGYTEGISSHDLPPIKHDKLKDVTPSCRNDTKHPQNNCLEYLQVNPSALRARTPTSAGMWNVAWNSTSSASKNTDYALTLEYQSVLWRFVQSRFGLSMETALAVHNYLRDHIRSIAIDNLSGQCTAGHSCKQSSRESLEAIIKNTA